MKKVGTVHQGCFKTNYALFVCHIQIVNYTNIDVYVVNKNI